MNILIQYGCIVVLCLLALNPSAINRSKFVFDDHVAIVRNSDVTNTTRPILETIHRILQHDFWGSNITSATSHKSYRPLVTLMFNLEYRMHHPDVVAVYMKWMNFWMHCAICCLLLITLPKLFDDIGEKIVWLSTAMFAIHPVHTEAVCGIVGRADLMCALFYILSINCYVELSKQNGHRWRQMILYVTLFSLTAVAVMCKEIGITILPFCIVYDILNELFSKRPDQRSDSNNTSKQPLPSTVIIRCTILAIMSLGIALVRLIVMNFQSPKFKEPDNPIAAAEDILAKTLSQQFLYSMNFWLLICPEWLCFDWSFGSIELVKTWLDVRVLAIFAFNVRLLHIILNGSRNVLIATAIIIVPFLPASGIIRLGFVMAERILYIPSIGYCLLVCFGFNRVHEKYPKISTGFAVFVCVIFMLKSNQRASDWANEEQLYRSALRVCPNNAKVYYNIGRLESQNGNDATAMNFYKYAIELYPSYDAALMNLGNLYRTHNQLDLAEKLIQKSIQITEEFPTAWMNLGIVKATKGKHQEALHCYKKALKYRRNYHTCFYNLGNLYLDMKNYTMAMESWKHSLSINPKQSPPWANILTLLDSEAKIDEVIALSAKALQFLPNDSSIMFLRANALGKVDRFEEAERLYLKIIQLQPEHALYHVNLGVLYHRWNRKAQAVDSYRNALKINPNLSNAKKYIEQLTKQNTKINE